MKTVLPWTLQTRSPILLILLCRQHNRNSSFTGKELVPRHEQTETKTHESRRLSPCVGAPDCRDLYTGRILPRFLAECSRKYCGRGRICFYASASDTPSAGEENADTTEATQPSGTVLQLTAADEANGSLILVDAAHPYAGAQAWTDFSAVTDTNVKPRDTSLQMQSEIAEPLCSLFDAYAAANGYANLQVYSTLDTTLSSTSIYTNVLPDRSSGYGFDIGLITSTGEVVPYITKRNEWMVTNSWEYGFILRYPSDKTETTGTPYAPHHFRYVGKIHAAIMHENNFCLEEYLDYLRNYTMESGRAGIF